MIEVTELTKYYGARRALDRCSFRIGQGEIVGLVGKNGAGKTTILRILSGQILPTEGKATIDGQSVEDNSIAARAKIGYLPETPPLYGEMTVSNYLRFACRLRDVPSEQTEDRVLKVMYYTGLKAVGTQRLGTLAKGFQQRVGIAQAIIHSPPVVLLDEPMGSLDPVQIVQNRGLILSLKNQHTVLLSSHILSEVTQVCERVILLDEGTIKAQGREDEIRSELLQRHRLSLLVRGTGDRLKEVLAPLGSIEMVIKPFDGRKGSELISVSITTEQDVREQVGRMCVEGGLGLLELREERHGLEELMLQLLEGGGAGPS